MEKSAAENTSIECDLDHLHSIYNCRNSYGSLKRGTFLELRLSPLSQRSAFVRTRVTESKYNIHKYQDRALPGIHLPWDLKFHKFSENISLTLFKSQGTGLYYSEETNRCDPLKYHYFAVYNSIMRLTFLA